MANEKIFTTKADEYAKSRPSYSQKAIEKIFEKIIHPGETAADIGSGTGILSNEFLSRGYDVFCVEPNEAMRTEAEKKYAKNEHFHSINAPAENTGLPENSISLITVASAFHWFGPKAFKEECKRILCPNGIVCILFNERSYDDFTKKQHEICSKYCKGFTSLSHGAKKTYDRADILFEKGYKLESFDFKLSYTKESFISRSLSSSYAPEKGTEACEKYTAALRSLLDAEFPEDRIEIANSTVMLSGMV